MIPLYTLLAFPGLMVGLLLWARVVHWILVATGMRSSTKPAPTVRVSFRQQVLLLALLVCSWLLVFAGLTIYVYGHAEQPGWRWFFGGVAATPIMVVPSNVIAWVRVQRRRAS